jgi:hypothetical protein
MNDKFSSLEVETKAFGVAMYLHLQGHPIIAAMSPDGSVFNCRIRFPASARLDMEKYYLERGRLNEILDGFLKAEQK